MQDNITAFGFVATIIWLLAIGTGIYNYLNTGKFWIFKHKSKNAGPYANANPAWIKHVRKTLPVSWIPITEKSPEDKQIVITYHKETGIDIMEFHLLEGEEANFGTVMFTSRLGFLTDDVTHWLPLGESIQRIMRETKYIPTIKREEK